MLVVMRVGFLIGVLGCGDFFVELARSFMRILLYFIYNTGLINSNFRNYDSKNERIF